MRSSIWLIVFVLFALLSPVSGADRMFGKNAAMRDISGPVIGSGSSSRGAHYVVVKDVSTGLRVYVQTDAPSCRKGTFFRATGHLTRSDDSEFDATFHHHLTAFANDCR